MTRLVNPRIEPFGSYRRMFEAIDAEQVVWSGSSFYWWDGGDRRLVTKAVAPLVKQRLVRKDTPAGYKIGSVQHGPVDLTGEGRSLLEVVRSLAYLVDNDGYVWVDPTHRIHVRWITDDDYTRLYAALAGSA